MEIQIESMVLTWWMTFYYGSLLILMLGLSELLIFWGSMVVL